MWDGIAYTSHNSELLETSLVSKLCCKATEDEKNIIRYYAARGEKDKVEEFYKLMERELNKRLQTTVNEQTRQEAYDKPILGAAKNIVADFAAPGAYMANAANVIANKFRDDYIPTDTNSPAFRGAHMVRETSSGVTERARDAAGGGTAGEIASLAAGTGLSMANFLSKAPLGGVGSMAAMGLSSAGQTTLDVLERGGTEGQALLLGTAAGAIEAMTEKLPLDNLFKIAREAGETGIKATVKELLKQGAIEATEEMISELANTILDVEVMRDKSEYQSYIASLMQNGMTREDAEKEAIFQIYGMNTLKAGAEGFLSGLVMGGGATAVSKVNTAIESRNAGAAEGEAGFTKNEYSEKVSNKIIRALDAIGKKLGVNIQIGAPTGTGQGSFNGYYENGRIVISQDADDPLKVVLSHEVTHRMKETAPEEYAKFLEIAVNATEQLSGKQKSEILEEYKTWYSEYSQTDFKHENALDEITADFAGRLADDLSLFKKLVDTDRNVAQRFIDGVREFISKVKSTFSKDKSKADTASLEKYGLKVSELEEAVKQWSAMVKATETAVKSGNVEIENTAETEQGGVRQYDLKKVNGKTVAWIESNPLTNKQIENPEEVAKYVAQNINDMYAIIEDGVKVYIGEDLPNEYTMSKYSQAIRSEKSGKWKAKVKAAAGLDLLIEAATGRKWEKTKHPQNKDAKYGMYRYNSTFAFPIKDRKGNVTNIRVYDVEMLIRNASDGKKYLYDIVEIKEDIPSAKSLKQKEASRATYEAAQRGNIFNNSIHDSSGKSNPQFSLKKNTDNLGRKLSDGQVEYFKDSKVRDKDGSLLVMYRGGNENFTVFDRKKSKYSNLYGRGFYFTDSESHAKQYGNVRAYYLDIKNPVSITEKTITKEQLRSYLEAVAENEDDYSFENYGYGATVDSVLESVYEGKSDFNMLYDISQTAIGDMVEAVELFNEVNGTDYDGLILDTETVTFKSNQAKSVDNKKPTENPDIRYSLKGKKLIEPDVERKAERERMRELEAENAKQKNTAETKSEVKGGNIEQYTTEEADGIRKDSQTFRNIIAGTDITLGEFFKKWKLGRKNGEKLEKLYLGKASERVKKQIGELLGYDIPNRDFIITNDAIKHIFDEHGDEQKEESVGQVVIDEKTISVLREALNNPDSITKEIRKKEPRIVFKKKTDAGNVVVVEVDNKGRATLSLKTFYIKKGQESTQRGDFPGDTRANLLTSETTVPNSLDDTTIPQESEDVKGEVSDAERSHFDETGLADDAAQNPKEDYSNIDALYADYAQRENIIAEEADEREKELIDGAYQNAISDPATEKKTLSEKISESGNFLKRKIVNSGAAIRDIAKATKDKVLYPIYNRARGSMNIAEDMLTNKQTNIRGEKVGESLESIILPIKNKGKEYFREFHLYLLNKHNVARMSLENAEATARAKAEVDKFLADNPQIARLAALGEDAIQNAAKWDDAREMEART